MSSPRRGWRGADLRPELADLLGLQRRAQSGWRTRLAAGVGGGPGMVGHDSGSVCHDSEVALVESVPNVSEGRRPEVVDRLATALESVPGAQLLDRTSDASHNRSVFTVAGESDAVADALERLVGVALREIDMEQQVGEHPRIGAVDVIPFVPLGETTLEGCIGLARAFGRRIAARFDLPVYLYAAAATRPTG